MCVRVCAMFDAVHVDGTPIDVYFSSFLHVHVHAFSAHYMTVSHGRSLRGDWGTVPQILGVGRIMLPSPNISKSSVIGCGSN